MRRIIQPRLKTRSAVLAALLIGGLVTVGAAVRLSAQSGSISRVSVNSAGMEANADSFFPALSADGRIIGFKSLATNLADPQPDDNQFDVFVHDRDTGVTTRASVTSFGFLGNDNSFPPALNDDGNLVAFASEATNMVPDDTNGGPDVFVRDRGAATTTVVSLTTSGVIPPVGGSRDLPPSISGSGRYVVFETTAILAPNDPNTDIADAYLRDREAGITELISVRTVTRDDQPALAPGVSGDGCIVAFVSPSDRLIPQGGDPNEKLDVYARNRCADPPFTFLITRGFNGAPTTRDSQGSLFPPTLNDNGELVAYESEAINLVPNDTNNVSDVFVYDGSAAVNERVSVNTYGEQGDGPSTAPSISGDGRYVAFVSTASNFVEGTDGRANIFVRDRFGNQTCQVSLRENLSQAAGDSVNPAISRDGQWIAFESTANLVPGGTVGRRAIYLVENTTANQICPPTATPTATVPPPTSTPGPDDCCQCGLDLCEGPSDGSCPEECDVVFQAACAGSTTCITFTPTIAPTPTPIPDDDDCCECPEDPNLCTVPEGGSCPSGCSVAFDSACLGDPEGCVANTPTVTSTPTPVPGEDDCCACPEDPNLCTVPEGGSCPSGCTVAFDSACLGVPEGCVANTPTATPGANDCCQCPDEPDLCSVPEGGACPEGCTVTFDSACLGLPQGCVANTPTAIPTPTPIPGLNDCCDCPEDPNLCTVPSAGSGNCPQGCTVEFDSACLGVPEGCVTNTPSATPTETPLPTSTPTATPPPGLNDCCSCPSDPNLCSVPAGGSCPTGCSVVFDAACAGAPQGCVTNTPTHTPGGATATPTIEAGDDDCCACPETPQLCAEPSGGLCPAGCDVVIRAACLGAPQGCVANTPTRTPVAGTPTPGAPVSGSGGGCGCETNPQPRNRTALALRDLAALFGPMVLWRWRRRVGARRRQVA